MADFQSRLSDLEQNGISVYALSTDDEEHAREVVDKNSLTFPVIFGVDGVKTSQAWGSYYEERRSILHATGFVLKPDRSIVSATYSTGPIGRLVAEDVINNVDFHKKQMAKG